MNTTYNKMQAQFLNEELLIDISKTISPGVHTTNKKLNDNKNLDTVITAIAEFETNHNDVLFEVNTIGVFNRIMFKKWLDEHYPNGQHLPDSIPYNEQILSKHQLLKYIECIDNDLPLPYITNNTNLEYQVKIVPTLDDTYPNVLNNINQNAVLNHIAIVYYMKYDGSMDLDIVKQIYLQSGVYLVKCLGIEVK